MLSQSCRLRGAPPLTSCSTVHKILRNRVYTGDFDFGGVAYRGTYEPIVPRELWEQVQAVMDDRGVRNTRKAKHQFAFSGLITCGHCGCAMVGSTCTTTAPATRGRCPERYLREEVLEARFTDLVAGIVFSDEMLEEARGCGGVAQRRRGEPAAA